MKIVNEQKRFVYSLEEKEREYIEDGLKTIIEENALYDLETAIVKAVKIFQFLPERFFSYLLKYRSMGNDDSLIVFRNLPIILSDRIDPPKSISKKQTIKLSSRNVYLLALSTLLGDVFSFKTQHYGNLIQDVVPLKTEQDKAIGTGGKVFLDWHVEDAFHDYRADYIGLFCINGHKDAKTIFCPVNRIEFKKKSELFKKKFIASIDHAHKRNDGIKKKISILSGKADNYKVRIDPMFIKCLTRKGEMELNGFLDQLEEKSSFFTLESGDLLFFDNKRVLHGRTAFSPNYSHNRWLKRISISKKFQNFRKRVI